MGPITAAAPALAAKTGFDWLSSGIGALGGILGFAGQKDANEANIALARENRKWQEKMSNTAYQRARADMAAANLNPILALGKPATTPGGNVAQVQNALGAGVNSAVAAAAVKNQIAQGAANVELTRNTAWKTAEEAAYLEDTRAPRTQTVRQILANEIMKMHDLGSATELKNAQAAIERARFPEFQSAAEFFQWLDSKEADGIFKGIGKMGPALQVALKVALHATRGKK